MFDAVTFDLDGTLLDALPDLTASTNAALWQFSLPRRTEQEMLAFIGKGMRYQIQMASGLEGEELDKCVQAYREHYARHCTVSSRPYEGVYDLLQTLHSLGVKTAIITNKPEAIAREIVNRFFPDCIDVLIGGDTPGIALKPDPSGIQMALSKLGTKNAVHMGDGVTDIKAAKAAGIPVIGVTWGYNDREKLSDADLLIDSPAECVKALEEMEKSEKAHKSAGRFAPLILLLLAGVLCYFLFGNNLPMAADGGMAVEYISQRNYTKTLCTVDGIKRSVKSSGCGATCVSMASVYYNGEKEEYTPDNLFTWAYQKGYYVGSGMDKNGMQALAEHCGLRSEWVDDTEEVLAAFKKKRLVIGYMGSGEFTKNGHFILLRGVNEEGRVLVNDPNSEERSEKTYGIDFIYDQLKYHPGFMIIWK